MNQSAVEARAESGSDAASKERTSARAGRKGAAVPEAWRPKVLYNKGRLSTRQFQAALALRSDWLCAGLACDNPVDLAERRGAAHRFDVAIGWLGRTTRAVIEAVVLRGESCEAAGRLPVIAGLYRGGWSERPRAFAAAAFLADGLNELADRYGLPA